MWFPFGGEDMERVGLVRLLKDHYRLDWSGPGVTSMKIVILIRIKERPELDQMLNWFFDQFFEK